MVERRRTSQEEAELTRDRVTRVEMQIEQVEEHLKRLGCQLDRLIDGGDRRDRALDEIQRSVRDNHAAITAIQPTITTIRSVWASADLGRRAVPWIIGGFIAIGTALVWLNDNWHLMISVLRRH